MDQEQQSSGLEKSKVGTCQQISKSTSSQTTSDPKTHCGSTLDCTKPDPKWEQTPQGEYLEIPYFVNRGPFEPPQKPSKLHGVMKCLGITGLIRLVLKTKQS